MKQASLLLKMGTFIAERRLNTAAFAWRRKHKLVNHNLYDMHTCSTRDRLFHRIKTISNTANMLQWAIEADLTEFSESKGIDMTNVRVAMKQYNHEI